MRKIYFELDGEGYVDGYGSTSNHTGGEIALVVPDDHLLFSNDFAVFKYVDGELIKDEERQEQLIAEQEKENSKLSIEDQNSIAILELAESIMKLGGQ